MPTFRRLPDRRGSRDEQGFVAEPHRVGAEPIVVLFTLFGLMFVLYFFDMVWRLLLSAVGGYWGGGGG